MFVILCSYYFIKPCYRHSQFYFYCPTLTPRCKCKSVIQKKRNVFSFCNIITIPSLVIESLSILLNHRCVKILIVLNQCGINTTYIQEQDLSNLIMQNIKRYYQQRGRQGDLQSSRPPFVLFRKEKKVKKKTVILYTNGSLVTFIYIYSRPFKR